MINIEKCLVYLVGYPCLIFFFFFFFVVDH